MKFSMNTCPIKRLLQKAISSAAYVFLFSFSFQLWANFDLLDAETDALLNGLTNSQTSINLNSLKKRSFNLKYSTSDPAVDVLEFYINGTLVKSDELGSPFTCN